MEICIAVPVWGKTYINSYCKYAIASMFAPGNLEVLKSHRTYFRLYTKKEDIGLFHEEPTFKILEEIADIEFIDISEWIENEVNKYNLMTRCHNDTILYCKNVLKRCYLFLHTADMLLANNVFSYSLKLAEQGKKTFALLGIPTDSKGMLNDCEPYLSQDKNVYDIPPEKLALFTARHVHHDIATHCVDSKYFNSDCPAIVIWRLPDEALLIRAFFIHPLMQVIDSNSKLIPDNGTLDGGDYRYVEPEEVDDLLEILTDSSTHLCALEFADRVDVKRKSEFNFLQVASWAKQHAHPVHLEQIKKRIFVNPNPKSYSLPVLQTSDDVVENMLELIHSNYILDDWESFQLNLLQLYLSKSENYSIIESFTNKILKLEEINQRAADQADLPSAAALISRIRYSDNKQLSPKENFESYVSMISEICDYINTLGKGHGFNLCYPLRYMAKIIDRINMLPSVHKHICLYGMGIYGSLLYQIIELFTDMTIEYTLDDYKKISRINNAANITFDEMLPKRYKSDYIILCSTNRELIKSMEHRCRAFKGTVISDIFTSPDNQKDE